MRCPSPRLSRTPRLSGLVALGLLAAMACNRRSHQPRGTQVYAYGGVVQPEALGDGDVVMLKNFRHGYLRCDAGGEVQASHSPLDLDTYVWEVRRVVEGQSAALRFEVIDHRGATGSFLTMSGDGDVSCGPLGDHHEHAAWALDHAYATGGTHYRKVDKRLVNEVRGRCLAVDGELGAIGAECSARIDTGFTLELIARGSAPSR